MTLNGAIKQLHELQSAEDMPFYYKPAIAAVIDVLLMDAHKVRHGHWVGDFCSVCGESALGDTDNFDIYGIIHSNYCPNCGARMDEVIEDA